MATAPLGLADLAEATGTIAPRLERLLVALELIGLVAFTPAWWQLTPCQHSSLQPPNDTVTSRCCL